MMTGWPPSSATPTSNDNRVRVEGFSNTTATARGPASAWVEYRSFFSRSASSSTSCCSVAVRSSSTRKWRSRFTVALMFPRSCARPPGHLGDASQQLGNTEGLGESRVLPEHVLQAGDGLDLAGDDDDGHIGERRVAA